MEKKLGRNYRVLQLSVKIEKSELAKQLEENITSKTKWLMLNSPSNPTGVLYSKDELKELAKVLLKYPDVLIMSDDIYEKIIYDELEFHHK